MVPQPDAIDVGLFNIRPDPKIVRIDQRDDGLPDIHDLTLPGRVQRHDG